MKIITTTSVFPPCRDMSDIVRRLGAIGFDGLDMAFDYCVQDKSYPFMTDAYPEWARRIRGEAELAGVPFSHGHAPFDAAGRGDLPERTLHCASLLGFRYLVVHPIVRNAAGVIYEDAGEFIAVNAEAIRPILSLAEKYGVCILTENLLWGASVPAANLSALVEEVNSPLFGWCYDTGHAHAFGERPDALIGLPRPPLSLHVQDNHGNLRDEHLLPGDGTIDWDSFVQVLGKIGYPGEFVLEAHHQSLETADSERDALLSELLRRARRIIG